MRVSKPSRVKEVEREMEGTMSHAVIQDVLSMHLLPDLTEVKNWHTKNIHRGESSKKKGRDPEAGIPSHIYVERRGQRAGQMRLEIT